MKRHSAHENTLTPFRPSRFGRRVFVIVCLAFLWSLPGGCRKQESPGGKQRLTIAVIPKSMGGEFWETVEAGARAACAELGVEMKWEGPLTETEIAEQNKIIENMVNLGVNGIALAPLNPKAMRKPVENAVAGGIPVLIFDSGIEGAAHISFVATDNVKGGRLGAQQLAKLLKPGARVVLQRFVQGTASTENRARGFKEEAAKLGLKIIAEPYAEDATVAGCKKTALNTLEQFIKNGELQVDGIFACNDRSSLGVLDALDDIRKSGIKVHTRYVGFDFSPRLVQGVLSGAIDALVVQDPYRMGYLAVKTLVAHLRKEKVPRYIDTGVRVVTKEALQKDPELRKLVGLK